MRDFKSIVRPNILQLTDGLLSKQPTISENIRVHLDANENPYNSPYNRYPKADYTALKNILGQIKGIWPHCIALSNGTNEAIDFILRVFCVPGRDNIISIAPTSRNYREFAAINDIECKTASLDNHFQITADQILSLSDEHTKIVFLCSPNNPTGNLLDKNEVLQLCDRFQGIVVVDEAYNEFSHTESIVRSISSHHNLIALNTLSKAFASAELRLAAIYAVPEIIRYIKAITPHHHISTWTQKESMEILKRRFDVDKWIHQLLEERRKVMSAIKQLPMCEKVYDSDANFFLVKFQNADDVYQYLLKEGIAVCNCSNLPHCENCLRITIGLPSENNLLIGALRKYKIH